MKQKQNAGYSLIEILIAIVLLGVIMVPTCTSLVTSIRVNERTEEMLQAQLAVSSAVETLMAEGISGASTTYDIITVDGAPMDRFPTVSVATVAEGACYKVTVKSNDQLVEVITYIRGGGTS